MFFDSKKSVYVIGCSNMGAYIANAMSELSYDVYVIDSDEEAFKKLSSEYSGFKIVGDGCDTDFLNRQIDKDAYLVLISTDSDNINSFIAQYVKKVIAIDFVITRIYDVEKHILMENSGIKIIYPSILTASKFFEIVKEKESHKDDEEGDK